MSVELPSAALSRRTVLGLCCSLPFAVESKPKPQALKPAPRSGCSVESVARRVPADIVLDLQSGTVLTSALRVPVGEDLTGYKPLDDEARRATVIYPASLTKLEAVKEMIRRLQSGMWDKTKPLSIRLLPGSKPFIMDYDLVSRWTMTASSNVLDRIVSKDFIESMNEHMRRIGMTNSRYLNATGYPTSNYVRENHVTTLHDLILSIVDFERNYAQNPEALSALDSTGFTGLGEIDIPRLGKRHHTFPLMAAATGDKAHPIPGVVRAKTGTTCDAGSGVYFAYEYGGRTFIFITLGHKFGNEPGRSRDDYAETMIATHQPGLQAFIDGFPSVPTTTAVAPQR